MFQRSYCYYRLLCSYDSHSLYFRHFVVDMIPTIAADYLANVRLLHILCSRYDSHHCPTVYSKFHTSVTYSCQISHEVLITRPAHTHSCSPERTRHFRLVLAGLIQFGNSFTKSVLHFCLKEISWMAFEENGVSKFIMET